MHRLALYLPPPPRPTPTTPDHLAILLVILIDTRRLTLRPRPTTPSEN